MTSHRFKRCAHCRIVYVWQSSGWCQSPLNDMKYCPECKKAINEALAKIPVYFRSVWQETDAHTVEFLLEQRKINLKRAQEQHPDRIIGERILAPLFDMKDPENINSNYEVQYNGETFAVEIWSKTPEKNKVKILMEENIVTGKRRPWKDV